MSNPTPEKSPEDIADMCLREHGRRRFRFDQKEQTVLALRAERAKRDALLEALTILAGLPDRYGQTHGAELHDAGKMAAFAREALKGARP